MKQEEECYDTAEISEGISIIDCRDTVSKEDVFYIVSDKSKE